jgi:two-component system OmpR family response regulator
MSAAADLHRILYVEDDPDIRTVASIALEIVGGFVLQACGSGSEALIASATFGADLFLLDVMMPDMDGPATLAHLRRQAPSAATPVIFMTARVQETELAYYRSLGAIGVIAKPFDPLQLAQQVRALWQQWRAGPQSPAP